MKHIISLGAGVQSSTMALMAAHGEITPMPDAAIFADTQAEPQEVYDWLDHLETLLPFPVYRVSKGSLTEDTLRVRTARKGHRYVKAMIPAFVEGHGIFGRVCTTDYKVVPLRKKMRELAGIHGKQCKETVVTQWMGISLDEIQRMKVSVESWLRMIHPLIDMKMTRQDCLQWMRDNNYPEPPRSACKYCPFHHNDEWRRLKENKDEWAEIVQFEKNLQSAAAQSEGAAKLRGMPYLHSSWVPIDEVDLTNYNDQQEFSFNDECAGMCGV